MFRNLGWAWFPIGLIGAMALVFIINGYMIYDAVTTFPGAAGADGFDLSNNYGKVLAATARQAQLGWTIDTDVDTSHRPALHLHGPDGARLANAAIDAKAERPVGPQEMTALAFHPAGSDLYLADNALPRGQWDVLLTIRADGRTYTTTRRLMVP